MENIREKAKAALADGTIHGDGHSILSLEAYAPHFTADDLGALVGTYRSDRSSVKSTIWDRNGNPMHEARGIYNLDFLFWLCGKVGGDTAVSHNFYGRGTQARVLVEEIARAVA